MEAVYLPEQDMHPRIRMARLYDTEQFGITGATPVRVVNCFELSTFLCDGGVIYINGQAQRIHSGDVRFSLPGDRLSSSPPFRCCTIFFQLGPEELRYKNELISAIQSGHNIEFREKYRGSNVLLIDDIQFISGKVSTQEEFFHTFNTLYEANRQIVFTSDRPPHEIARLEDRLRSRFESGLLCDIQAPDYETRMAIIKNKTMQMNSLLPEEVMNCIAEKMTANVRQIEGAVKCVTAQQDLMGREITPKLTEEILKRYVQEEVAFTPTPDMIIEETARFYNITAEDIKGRLKTKNITLPRQISMYIIRTRANLSLNDIGDIFGRDHSTILHAINKIEEDIRNDGEFAKTIKDIISNIYSKQ